MVAVICDMDGLLLDSERVSFVAMQRACSEIGLQFELEHYVELIGLPPKGSKAKLIDLFGNDFPYDLIRKQELRYKDEYVTTNGMPLRPGVVEFLETLSAKNIKLGVATSTFRDRAEHDLTITGLRHFFEKITCGDEVENGKPAPDIYLEAAKRLDVSPLECIVFEDSEAGIRAASAAGMKPVWIPDLKPASVELMHLVVGVFTDLLEALGSELIFNEIQFPDCKSV